MKRLALILALAAASAVIAAETDIDGSMRIWTEAQALTRAAPTLVTEGMSLRDIDGYRPAICADSGQTLSGAGTLTAYVWDVDLALWVKNPTLNLAVTNSAVRCQAFPDVEVRVPSGRVLYAATGVTVSSGTCTVRVKGRVKR